MYLPFFIRVRWNATTRSVILLGFLILFLSCGILWVNGSQAASDITGVSLEQALTTALQNNRLRTISRQSVEIAEAQYQQALSAHWPSLTFNAGFQRRDETATFDYPAQRFDLNLGFPTPPIAVPRQEITLLGRDTALYSLELMYPLYTGGKRSSLIKQAQIGKDIAATEVRRTDLQVVQEVKRYYYAALYTKQLSLLAKEIAISFEVLRDITQAFYEGGSNSVNKLDLLQTQLAHSLAKSTHADLIAKHKSALAALSFSMGQAWQEQIQISDARYPQDLVPTQLEHLIAQALQFNPQLQKLTLAVDAYQAKVGEAESEYYPTLALHGSVDAFNNDVDGGLNNNRNRNSWTLGIGMRMSLFNGGLTRHKVSAAKISQAQMAEQRLLVSDGIAAQVKNRLLEIEASQRQLAITETAIETSRENLDLNNRAYQTGAVKTEKVIEASLFDALIRANNYRAQHDQALSIAEIAYLLGREAME